MKIQQHLTTNTLTWRFVSIPAKRLRRAVYGFVGGHRPTIGGNPGQAPVPLERQMTHHDSNPVWRSYL
ncbi:hypothetical protein FB379_1535 [Aeribacillus composti]|nr:hypothetical protein FB379_1535 [Aeribacillus composti]